mgnify:CR=1 FL=1
MERDTTSAALWRDPELWCLIAIALLCFLFS